MAKKAYPKQARFTAKEQSELMGAGCEIDTDEAEFYVDNYFVGITKSEVDKGAFIYPVRVEQDGQQVGEDGSYMSFESLIDDLNTPYDDDGRFKFVAA